MKVFDRHPNGLPPQDESFRPPFSKGGAGRGREALVASAEAKHFHMPFLVLFAATPSKRTESVFSHNATSDFLPRFCELIT